LAESDACNAPGWRSLQLQNSEVIYGRKWIGWCRGTDAVNRDSLPVFNHNSDLRVWLPFEVQLIGVNRVVFSIKSVRVPRAFFAYDVTASNNVIGVNEESRTSEVVKPNETVPFQN
jgi:hypothetical protein